MHRSGRPLQGAPRRLGRLKEGGGAGAGEADGDVSFADFPAVKHLHRLAGFIRRGHLDEIVEGLDAALERAEAYHEAGADVLFIEAPQSIDEMRQLCGTFRGRVPLLANMVEGGKTPIKSAEDLADLGYSIAIFPGGAVRAISRHLQVYYDGLLANGSNAGFADRMHDFNGLNDIIGTAELLDLGKHYEEKDPTG